MRRIGYARVSTKGQDYELQVEALKAAGCERIYSEKESGKSLNGRPQFKRLMASLLPGDTVIVTRLDRLARSSRDLLNIIHDIEQAGCRFQSLAETWCDTSSPTGRLLVTILGGIGEFERSLILARTEAGIDRARAQGTEFGRPRKLSAGQRRVIGERYSRGERPEAMAQEYGVSPATVYRVLQVANQTSNR